MMRVAVFPIAALLTAGLVACGEVATLPASAGYGPNPTLPEPRPTLIPTVNVAAVRGWAAGETPRAADGLRVAPFATGLDHPRWLCVLPNGDVLVAETNAPPKPAEEGGVTNWVMRKLMRRAGAAVPSPNRIILLRDADGDGIAETRSVFLDGLDSPFGMALVGDTLYVANADAVVAVPYTPGAMRIDATPRHVTDLPGGPRNHHWTKSLIASPDGHALYATVGSNSNAGENGMAEEDGRAAIWRIDLTTGEKRLHATGLRNPNGMAWAPADGALWTVVNERDAIGSDLVPDYLTSVRDGGFYGWPYSWYGQHVDVRVAPQRPDLVARAIRPDYALGAHTASLGLAWSGGTTLPTRYANGMFVGQHGSWNRRPANGYQVIFVPFEGSRPAGLPIEVLTGFLNDAGEARGRPVGVALDRHGALLVADDVGNTVWRVTAAP